MGLLFDSYALDVLVTLATLAYVIYAYATSTYSYWKDRGIPYKKPAPFLGVVKDRILGHKGFPEILMDIYNEAPEAYAIGFFEFRQPRLMIRDLDLIEKVLIKDFASFHARPSPFDIENDPITANLFTVEGPYWRNLRYKLTPVFTTGKLKSMFEQMASCAENLVKYIEKQSKNSNDSSFEGRQLITILSLDVIASCAFGLEFSSESEEGKRFREMIKKFFAPSKLGYFRPLFIIAFPKLAKILKTKTIPPDAGEYFMNITKRTINFRRENNVKRNDFLQMILTLQKLEQENKLNTENMHDDTNEEDAELNQLDNAPVTDSRASTTKSVMVTLFMPAVFTDECLAAQCFSFLAAGSHPVANATAFCLYALADNVHVQERLQKEVDSVLKKYNGKWTYAAVKELKYLDQVISETHRMYPSVPFLERKCTKPFQIPDTKYVMEPDTHIVIPVSCLHHDEKYFPDPQTFDPERFAEGKTVHKGTYVPFGDGPRICIGMRFAQLEIKVCIAHIVSAFSIRVNKKTIQPLQYESLAFFLSPVGGLWLEFEKRNKT